MVWFKGFIPRHSFICWLAFLDRMATRDRIHKWLSSVPLDCLFCGLDKSRNHLFFECAFSSQVWQVVIAPLGKPFSSSPTRSSIINWGYSALKRSTVVNTVLKLAFEASIYHIWRERNARMFASTMSDYSAVASAVKHDLECRILGIAKLLNASKGTAWGSALGFS